MHTHIDLHKDKDKLAKTTSTSFPEFLIFSSTRKLIERRLNPISFINKLIIIIITIIIIIIIIITIITIIIIIIIITLFKCRCI